MPDLQLPKGTEPPEPRTTTTPIDPVQRGPDRTPAFAIFLKQIDERRLGGEAARRAILDRLAVMTVPELRKISPLVFSRLGPAGLAQLAERSAALRPLRDGGQPVREIAPRRALPARRGSFFTELQRRRPLPWQAFKVFLGAMLVAVGTAPMVPLLWRIVVPEEVVGGLHRCRALDRFTGDCAYRVGSARLSLGGAAEQLHLSADVLAAANPGLAFSGPLPSDTLIRIPPRRGFSVR